jgi:DNA-binding PadR family transcriptional regulator
MPLELAICVCALDFQREGNAEFHGYAMARHLGDLADSRLLTAYGTLYRALGRLATMGLLQSRWEDPEIPARENRPGRRLYMITGAGEAAVRQARMAPGTARPHRRLRRRPATA